MEQCRENVTKKRRDDTERLESNISERPAHVSDESMSTCTTSDHDVLRGSAARSISTTVQHTGEYMYDTLNYPAK